MARKKQKKSEGQESLGEWFDRLRTRMNVNVSELTERLGYNRSTAYRIMNGDQVRWSTVEGMLRGMGFEEGDPEMEEALELWASTSGRARGPRYPRDLKGYDRFMAAVRVHLRDVPEEDWPAVLRAIQRPQVRHALVALGSGRTRWS